MNIGLRACPLGKHSQTMRKNFFPRLVFTLISKGGLYHVIFLFLDQVEELKVFESRMTDLIRDIEFSDQTNDFQRKLREDMKSVKEDNHLVVKADKTTNFYRMKPCDYKNLVNKNIQKSYKKANKGQEARINKDAKAIAEELDLSDRVETMAKRDAFHHAKRPQAQF